MVEVEEKRNGAGDATVHNQSKEKAEMSTDSLQLVGKKLGEMKLTENLNTDMSPDITEATSENEETAEDAKVRRQVVVRGVTGKIKWFNVARGYGFIERNDNEQDVFLHQSAVVRRGRKPRYSLFLKGGEDVEFDVVEGLKGLEAAAVSAPGGLELFTFNPRPQQRKTTSEGGPDQRRQNTQRRPYKPWPGYKGGRKNNRKQTDSDQKATGDDSDRGLPRRRGNNNARRNRSSSKTSDSEVATRE